LVKIARSGVVMRRNAKRYGVETGAFNPLVFASRAAAVISWVIYRICSEITCGEVVISRVRFASACGGALIRWLRSEGFFRGDVSKVFIPGFFVSFAVSGPLPSIS
jgi:hypothetical protein